MKQNFRLAWTNLEGEESAGSSFAHEFNSPAPMCLQGNGEHNVQILMTTPRGKLLNAIAGYVPEKALVEELTLTLNLLKKTKDMRRWEQRQFIAAAHKRRLAELKTMDFDGVLGQIQRGRLLADRKYCRDHALIDASRFRTEDMVGNAKTFFGSSTGSMPKGRIGASGSGNGDLGEIIRRAKKRIEGKKQKRKVRKGPVKI